MRKRGRKKKPEADITAVTGDRMTVPEYRAYLKAQGLPTPLVMSLSQGGQQVATQKPAKKNKFNAQPVRDEKTNQLYASKKEAKRGMELDLMQRQGLITGLRKQPRYRFGPNRAAGMRNGLVSDKGNTLEYWPDFEYYDSEGEFIVEDVKGLKKGAVYQLFKVKKMLMWAYHGIEVQEI